VISAGKIAGLHGISWATTEFTFDPMSENGYFPIGGTPALLDSAAFQSTQGADGVLAFHSSTGVIPEPGSCAMLLVVAWADHCKRFSRQTERNFIQHVRHVYPRRMDRMMKSECLHNLSSCATARTISLPGHGFPIQRDVCVVHRRGSRRFRFDAVRPSRGLLRPGWI
jgi:hypothetical protein